MRPVVVVIFLMILRFSFGQSYVLEKIVGDFPENPVLAHFDDPASIASDLDGNVYVTESRAKHVQKFDSNGTFLAKWNFPVIPYILGCDISGVIYIFVNGEIQKFDGAGTHIGNFGVSGNGVGLIYSPREIIFSSSGNIYVLDYSKILKYNNAGVFQLEWGVPTQTGGFCIDDQGNLYVTEYLNAKVKKYNEYGGIIREWGGYGTSFGQFLSPKKIGVVENGYIFVSDSELHNIQKFDSTGQYISSLGTRGTNVGQFNYPSFTISFKNELILFDFNDRIQVFDSEFNYNKSWGDGFVFRSAAVAVSKDKIFVFDGAISHNVFVFDYNWNFKYYFICLTCYEDVDFITNEEHIYIVQGRVRKISKYSFSGDSLFAFGSSGVLPGQFEKPTSACIDQNNQIIVCEDDNMRVQIFDTIGNSLRIIGEPGSGDGQFTYPTSVANDPEGNIYVADPFSNRIQKFTNQGAFIRKWGDTGELLFPGIVEVDKFSNVYVADQNGFHKFDSVGSFITTFPPVAITWNASGGGGSFAFDSIGRVYIPAGERVLVYYMPPDFKIKNNGSTLTTGASFDFGTLTTQQSSAPETFEIENQLAQSYLVFKDISSIVIEGANPNDFTFVRTTLGRVVEGGNSGAFEIRFRPTSPGAKSAIIRMRNNDVDDSTFVISVSGIGILPFNISVLPEDTGMCQGASVQLDAQLDNVSYTWFRNGTQVSTLKKPVFAEGGEYVLEVQDGLGNTARDTCKVHENAAVLEPGFLFANQSGVEDELIVYDLTSPSPDSIVWNWNGGTAIKVGAQYRVTFPAVGNYPIQQTSWYGYCSATSMDTVKILPGTLFPLTEGMFALMVVEGAPNPTSGMYTLTVNLELEDQIQIEIFDVYGNAQYRKSSENASKKHVLSVDLSAWANGNYTARIVSSTDTKVIRLEKI